MILFENLPLYRYFCFCFKGSFRSCQLSTYCIWVCPGFPPFRSIFLFIFRSRIQNRIFLYFNTFEKIVLKFNSVWLFFFRFEIQAIVFFVFFFKSFYGLKSLIHFFFFTFFIWFKEFLFCLGLLFLEEIRFISYMYIDLYFALFKSFSL